MKDNTKIILIGIFTIGVLFSIAFFNPTFSKTPDLDSLKYNNNEDVTKDNIYNFISYYDDYLIPNTSYNLSNVLNENYDFLVDFACSYILNNETKYDIKIINHKKYIDIEEVYNITYNLFDRRNFYIINDNDIRDNMIELKTISERIFNLKLKEIKDYDKIGDNIYVIASYDSKTNYKYSFLLRDDRLIIENVELINE